MLALTYDEAPRGRLKEGTLLRVCELRKRIVFAYPDVMQTPAYIPPKTIVSFPYSVYLQRRKGVKYRVFKPQLGVFLTSSPHQEFVVDIFFEKEEKRVSIQNLFAGSEAQVEFVPPPGSTFPKGSYPLGVEDQLRLHGVFKS